LPLKYEGVCGGVASLNSCRGVTNLSDITSTLH
jgi:hypothetical protein